MLTVGNCRICGTGPLGLRLCGSCRNVVILCKECDAAWIDANLERQPVYADDESMPCPHCTASLWSQSSAWATEKEIEANQWISEALKDHHLSLTTMQEGNSPLNDKTDDDELAS